MKKLLFTSLLALGLLLPTTYSASTNGTSSVEFSSKKPKKSSRKSARTKKAKSYKSKNSSSRSYSQRSKNCTYNGHELFVGSRGGCYYYSGNSKKYVERAYCSGCN